MLQLKGMRIGYKSKCCLPDLDIALAFHADQRVWKEAEKLLKFGNNLEKRHLLSCDPHYVVLISIYTWLCLWRMGAGSALLCRIVVNAELSGIQSRNLQATWGVPVLDRVGLILEIFAQRARTKEAKLQVSVALQSL